LERIINIIGAVLLAGVAGAMIFNGVQDPLAEKRERFARQFSGVGVTKDSAQQDEANFDAWRGTIASKVALWEPISETPKPPPPPPPKVATCPPPRDLIKKLNELGVRFTRQQIGQKIKVVRGEGRKAEFMTVGESIQGYTIVSFDKSNVELMFNQKEGNLSCPCTAPRE